jgi:hypothetical protein
MQTIEIEARGMTFSGLADGPTTGPYRLEVIEGAHQPILQAEPDKLTKLLVANLAEHAVPADSATSWSPRTATHSPTQSKY